MSGRSVKLDVISTDVSHKPSHEHFQPPFNSKTPMGLTLFWPLVALSSLTPTRFSCPIGSEGLYRRQGLKMGGGGIERSTYSGKALKRQVLIWDFKCFSQ